MLLELYAGSEKFLNHNLFVVPLSYLNKNLCKPLNHPQKTKDLNQIRRLCWCIFLKAWKPHIFPWCFKYYMLIVLK